MAISGAQKAITPARAGLARSGATRAGWPLAVGIQAWTYAISNIARSGATRSNYTGGGGFVSIGGIHVGVGPSGGGKIVGNLTITDVLNETPNRATFRVRGVVPAIGQDVLITIGSKNNGERLFAGQILNLSHGYTGTPANYHYDVSAIDWTFGLRQRLVLNRWTNVSGTTIAQELLALGAPGFSSEYVAAGLPALDEFTVSNQDVPTALSNLVQRLGGYWYVDYYKRLHLYTTADPAAPTAPQPINPIHPTLRALVIDHDGGQFVTRVYIEAGGSNSMAELRAGETMIPVDSIGWYEPTGGEVISGPQRLRYTGVFAGGGGALVGPGASASSAPRATVIGGAGMEAGQHDYAVTFQTAAGESLVSPKVSAVVGLIQPPETALTIGSMTAGAGPDSGWHGYGVTFVTATGETIIGPLVGATVPDGAAPLAAPVPATPGFNGAIEPGSYQYLATFETAGGESMPGPASSVVTLTLASVAPTPTAPVTPGTPGFAGAMELDSFFYTMTFETADGEGTTGPGSGVTLGYGSPSPVPVSAPLPGTPTTGGSIEPNTFHYAMSHQTAAGESTIGPYSEPVTIGTTILLVPPGPVSVSQAAGNFVPGNYRWGVTFVTATGETTISPLTAWIQIFPGNGAVVFGIPIGPANVTQRKIYRSQSAGSSTMAHCGTIANNTATTFDDLVLAGGPGSTGQAPPTTSTVAAPPTTALPLTLPLGPAGVTSRLLYRTVANSGVWRRVTAIGNNTATTYTDTSSTSSIAGNPAPSPGAPQSSVPLTIPTGPAGVTARSVYRSSNGAPVWRRVVRFANNSTTAYTDTSSSASIAGNPGPSAGTTQNAIPLTAIPTGPSGTQKRHIYRAKPGFTGYQKVTTIANNSSTTYTDTAAAAALGAAPPTIDLSGAHAVTLTKIPLGGADVTGRRIYRTSRNNAEDYRLILSIADNTTATIVDTVRDSARIPTAPPTTGTALANRVALSAIPVGASAVIARKLYRTAAGGGALKYLASIADNVTTVYTDQAVDATLGAAPPATDGSGLQQPAGQVNPGSTSLIVAGASGFAASGGWAVIGNGQQVIRYTAISASALTGIPASGPGSIEASISYNSTVTAAPSVTGIPASGTGAIRYPIKKGDAINLWMTVDDAAAQALVTALFTSAAGGTHSGIVEDVIQDRRLSATEARARGRAHLAARNEVQLRVKYNSRDINTRAGQTIVVNILVEPYHLTSTFVIQSVTIREFTPALLPVFEVEASSERFTFEDLIRRMREQPRG